MLQIRTIASILTKRLLFQGLFCVFIAGSAYAGIVNGFPILRDHMQKRFAETHEFITSEYSDDADNTDYPDENAAAAVPAEQDISQETGSKFVSWIELGKTKMNFSRKSGEEILLPEYAPSIKVLNAKIISVKGFMFPLDTKRKQDHFLVSPYTATCPFCLPAPPSQLIEVFADDPIKFSLEPISIKGQFLFVTSPEEMKSGILYKLTQAAELQ